MNYYHRWYQTLLDLYIDSEKDWLTFETPLLIHLLYLPLKGFKEAICSKLAQSIANKEPCVALLIASGE